MNEEQHRTKPQALAPTGQGPPAGRPAAPLEGLCLIDLEGRILDCNPACSELFGYAPDELRQRRVDDLIAAPGDSPLPDLAAQIQQAARAGQGHFETRARRKDGTSFPAEVSLAAAPSLEGRLCLFWRDLSLRQHNEERLQEAEEMVADILRHSPGSAIILDKDLNILAASDRFLHDNQLSAGQALGRNYLEIFPKTPGHWRSVMQRCLAGAMINSESGLQYRPDGSPVYYTWYCRPRRQAGDAIVGIFIYSEDITERKLAENKLRQSEEFNRHMIETANEGICFLDQDLVIRFVNPRMAKMLGCDVGELLGRPYASLLLPVDVPNYEERITELERGGRGHYERRLLRKDGSLIWTLVSSTPVASPEGKFAGAFGMFSDITERKKDEETILRFKTIFDLADFGAIIVALDGVIAYINAYLAEIHGYQPGELLGKNVAILYSPEQLARLDDQIHNLLSRGRLTGFEVLSRRRDGVEFPTRLNGLALKDEFGAPAFFAATITDLSEQKRAEQQILETQRNLIEAQRVAKLGSFDLDLQMGIGPWSDGLYRLVGRDPALGPLTTTEFLDMVHPDDRQKIIDSTAYIVQLKRGASYEYRIDPGRQGLMRHFISRVEPVLDENGQVARAIGTIQDISELKEAERQIRKLNDELEQRVAERTAQLAAANKELEAFSYSVSHDLRAPLRGIDGWSQALIEDFGPQLDPQAQGYLQRVRSETKHMSRLIEGLLQLSRLSRAELSKEPVDLSALAEVIANRLQESEPERQVTFAIQPGLKAYGDPRLLEVALSNLLGNAFKFTSRTPQARIEFGLNSAPGGAAPAPPTPGLASYLEFFVHDNGAGFDMAFAGKLFNPFQRIHKASEFPGAGIGLATVQRIIHRHGGQVRAEAEPNQGAAFYFSLEAVQS